MSCRGQKIQPQGHRQINHCPRLKLLYQTAGHCARGVPKKLLDSHIAPSTSRRNGNLFTVPRYGNSTVTSFAAFFPTLLTRCVKPPGTHKISPDFKLTGV